MSPRAKGPAVSPLSQAGPAWLVLGIAWAGILLSFLAWLAGQIATAASGYGWSHTPFGFRFTKDLVTQGPDHIWPHTSAALFVGLFVVELLVIGLPVTLLLARWVRNRAEPGDPLPSLASARDVAVLTPAGVRQRAVDLRESLSTTDARRIPPNETGVPLGTLRPSGPELRASWEDVAIAIMAPRSGKTTAEAVPAIIDAPGAVVVTSNKADVWAASASLRHRHTGQRVWVFDPQHIAHVDQDWWWNPLRGVRTYDAAFRLAMHFMQEVRQESGGGEQEFWVSAAADLLTGLLLAAGHSGGTLDDVYGWLNDSGDPTPVHILRDNGDEASASSVYGRQSGAAETREGIYEYARTACRSLRNPEIMRWVRPPDGSRQIDEFLPEHFAPSRQTIYLLSKDGAAAAAPLVAALADRILVESTREAERRPRGRLDPPMVVILDEAANICRIADLPALYSHLGSRGIFVLTILQSRSQARSVWGRAGFETLWGAATIKIVGAGIDDPELAEDVSKLIGDHDVTVRSTSYGSGSHNESMSLRRERILPPDAIRAMPKGVALLLATGCRPASLKLLPWYEGPHAKDIRAAHDAAMTSLTDRAQRLHLDELAAKHATDDITPNPTIEESV